ncbi:MoxR-like ATPase [Thermosporothrix hazakensis]|uniref:MoxR-like ATPase n=2 Tax=Thermosporothrix TaxID=768650 RepID=A0A326UCH4_THEHA|nr:MoxR family ATPase [Thermosporothrix hazakensis]PZW36026.1 MoxR-like ATPase [Thermosporothrix hazakensis]BBH88493.1 ATPase [Thermosporothrix sp. COM3]GCE46678.1 ATPase [Thermosporothrix hazakensis]
MQELPTFATVEDVQRALYALDYIADRPLATAIFLALKRRKPLLLEGEPGVGKTEVAKVLAGILQTNLIRLQCYEGIDVSTAVYEWNYTRQMLHIRLMEASGAAQHQEELKEIFGPDFLIQRPLLQAIDPANAKPPVLLIDELDRSDEEFEAYLLELLSDFQITIPEIGTIQAKEPPFVIITSNRTREIHDALRRRCLYYWIDYPTIEKEFSILLARQPQAPEQLARQVCAFVSELRSMDLYKAPGVAETLDWISSLLALDQLELVEGPVRDTLGALLKYQDDVLKVGGSDLGKLIQKIKGAFRS